MRITNSITTQFTLRTLQSGQQALNAAAERASSGLRFDRAAQDPTGAAQVMRTSGSLRALDQYQRNIDSASSRTSAEESVLGQLGDALTRARELGLSQATGTATADSRLVAKAEVDQLLRFAVSLADTTSADGTYVFGGTDGTTTPFTLDESDPAQLSFTTTSPSGEMKVEIASGQLLSLTHDGTEVFGTTTSGPLSALRDLSAALAANDQVAIGAATVALKSSFDGVQSQLGETGARMNQLDVASSNLSALKITLTTFKSDVQEVDFEQAATELVTRQTAYQAAMLATSRVLGMNLTDYLT